MRSMPLLIFSPLLLPNFRSITLIPSSLYLTRSHWDMEQLRISLQNFMLSPVVFLAVEQIFFPIGTEKVRGWINISPLCWQLLVERFISRGCETDGLYSTKGTRNLCLCFFHHYSISCPLLCTFSHGHQFLFTGVWSRWCLYDTFNDTRWIIIDITYTLNNEQISNDVFTHTTADVQYTFFSGVN